MDSEEAIQRVYDESEERIRTTDCAFHRYLYSQIDWTVRVVALRRSSTTNLASGM